MIDEPQAPVSAPPPAATRVALPLHRPIFTYVLLGLIIVVYLAVGYLGGSVSSPSTMVLLGFGAQYNALVAEGQHWRLLTAMFLHAGLTHILFNGWALYVLGREVETFFGWPRFLAVYFLGGLFGSAAVYLFDGPQVISVGASGAIFALVGAEIAFFLRNRRVLGTAGRQQLRSLIMVVVINMIISLSPGISLLAHLGGLVGGAALGLALTPLFTLKRDPYSTLPEVVNRNPIYLQFFFVLVAIAVLFYAVRWGDQRYALALMGML